ncbi:mediator of RNA polymerase II transcription subunit 15 isoform X1 [Onthophagus taurus]|uniref:mediator of RNA polymerase II transcription subunit 15 isoform X1 n=1 Tax=Onthophagus taurus TaxID=166361 RepID=UPI0039BDC6A6
MADETSWRTPTFRQNVVSKIDEAIRQSGMSTSRNSIDMENHVFQKAKTREEYLGFVARLILHVREMNTKKGAGMNGPGGGHGAPGMPDPINALQNLASQGSRNNQMIGMAQPGQMVAAGPPQQTMPSPATNLLQSLNQRGPENGMVMQRNMAVNVMQQRPPMGMPPNGGPMANQMGGQIPNQMAGQMANANMGQIPNQMQNLTNQLQGPVQNPLQGQMTAQMNQGLQQNMGGPMGGQIPNQMAGQMGNQMGNQMGGPMSGQMGNQMSNQMANQMGNQMSGQMANQMANQMGNQMSNQMGNQISNQMTNQMGNQMQTAMLGQLMPQQKGMNAPNTNFPRNPTPTQFLSHSPSPSVQSPVGMTGPPTNNQMVASPALAPSPGSQISLMAGQRSVGMAPSPSSSLNTPGQPNPSPMAMADEQAYREKVRQLSKYIDPLRKVIQRIGNDGENNDKMTKMKKLLDILLNPSQRLPLDTLVKCELVLEKIDFKRSDGSVPPMTTTFKEQHAFNPFIEALSNNIHSPVINHTLHRTFGPTLEALFGPEIKLVPPLKRKKIEEPTSEIPDVLQGEIARLDQRFKVSLDPNQQSGSKTIQLICWLDDKYLPCVPPISLTVPEDYPVTSPKCHMAAHEYNATEFLSVVQSVLLARIKKLPKHFSVSQLLDTWEMSVRQASAPVQKPIHSTPILMGL